MMILPEVWPKQRGKRKTMSEAEREHRAKVRRNKKTASNQRTNARISEERAERAKQRAENAGKVRRNEVALENYARLRYKTP